MDRQYVGIDFHRRRSVIIRKDADGTQLAKTRIANSSAALAAVIADAGEKPEVIIEATYGWYWAVDLLQQLGANVHLASPSGLNWGQRRVKNDERDANDLIDLLRVGRLPEAWIAPPATRALRELVRYRFKLVSLRTGLKAQVHAVMAKEGVLPVNGELFGVAGNAQLDAMELADPYTVRVASLRDVIAIYDREVAMLERRIHASLRDDAGYKAIQAINGVGPTLAAIFVAEIGDVHRFRSAEALCSWAGLTPRHHESDDKVTRGAITRQGSRLVRWAAIEAVSGRRSNAHLQAAFKAIADRRGKFKARTAVARKLLTLIYYGLRDGEIRSIAT
jgi:transposase